MLEPVSREDGDTKVLRFSPYFNGGLSCSLAILSFPLLAVSEPAWAVGKPTSNEDVKKCYESRSPDLSVHYCTRASHNCQRKSWLGPFTTAATRTMRRKITIERFRIMTRQSG